MKRLTEFQIELLRSIKTLGTYCPARDLDPSEVRALHELVKANRLSVEPNEGAPPRYSLTAQGLDDAS